MKHKTLILTSAILTIIAILSWITDSMLFNGSLFMASIMIPSYKHLSNKKLQNLNSLKSVITFIIITIATYVACLNVLTKNEFDTLNHRLNYVLWSNYMLTGIVIAKLWDMYYSYFVINKIEESAQQVDAPEPATMVSPASPTSHRPAR